MTESRFLQNSEAKAPRVVVPFAVVSNREDHLRLAKNDDCKRSPGTLGARLVELHAKDVCVEPPRLGIKGVKVRSILRASQ